MTAPVPPQEEHRLGQTVVASSFVDMLRSIWQSLVSPRDLKASLPEFTIATHALTQQYSQASGAGALSYYRAERVKAGIVGRPTLRIAPPPPTAQVESSVNWATKDLWAPPDDPTKAAQAVTAAQDRIVAATERMVLNRGRDTIIGAVHADPKAKGWARVTEPGACSFCLLLSTRGAVYKSEASGGFKAHDHCECHVEPLFGSSYEKTAQIRAAEDIYRTSTRGKRGSDARNAFRVAIDTARADGHPLL